MKNYDAWYVEIERKIEEKNRESKAKKVKLQKAAALAVCFVFLIGTAFSVSYGLNIRESVPTLTDDVGDDTGLGVGTHGEGSTEQNDNNGGDDSNNTGMPTGPVTYKQEDGTYSWAEGKNYAYAIGGTPYTCPEGHLSWIPCGFHSYPSSLYAYVMNDPTLENIDIFWKTRGNLANYTVKFRCNGFTILRFIQDYGITREEFDENVDLVEYYGYNLDVLFSGDEAAASEYYLYRTVFSRRSECKSNYNELRVAILAKYDVKNRADEVGLIQYLSVTDGYMRLFNYSVPELVYLFDIPREELEELINTLYESKLFNKDTQSFDYDFSVIYNEDGTIKEELSALDRKNNDAEGIVKLSVHLGELFCRIYDWEDAASFGDDIEIEDIDRNNYYITKCNCMLKMVREYVDNRYGWDPIDFHRDVTSKECPLRAMLDEYEVTREEFETYIDFDNYPFYDIDELYYGTAEEILELCNSEEHIEAHRERDYKNSAYSALSTFIRRYYPDASGVILDPGPLHEMIRKAQISREELIAIIAEVEKCESPTQVYYGGAFYCYDYDLSVIYNEDGSFKDLSKYDDDTVKDMFCRRGEYAE